MESLIEKVKELETRFAKLLEGKDLEKIHQEILSLEAKSMKTDFWQDPLSAKEIMTDLSALQNEEKSFSELSEALKTVKELINLEEEEKNVEEELGKIEKRVEILETGSFLSGKYDPSNAIISIHAGQGGTEAMDWAAMLARMYLRYADKKGWATVLIDESKGEEAGIKSISVEIKGKNSYGLLKKEAGTHRLVRQSPFNADALRQTSFALVEVLPVVAEAGKIEINPDEIELEAFRSSGPGGQNVQKVNTAVRIRHKPTGITVTAQSERSQLQNRENAMKVLRAKLSLLEEAKRDREERKLKGEYKTASWGNQIRSYVLHPYKQVKDLRTGFTTNDTEAVLAGELDGFIEAELSLR